MHHDVKKLIMSENNLPSPTEEEEQSDDECWNVNGRHQESAPITPGTKNGPSVTDVIGKEKEYFSITNISKLPVSIYLIWVLLVF